MPTLPLEIITTIAMLCSVSSTTPQGLDQQRHCQAAMLRCVEGTRAPGPSQALQACVKEERVK